MGTLIAKNIFLNTVSNFLPAYNFYINRMSVLEI